jgi:SAM-dependent methyltransferase
MFTESAELYDALYFTWKDYAAEAADVARRVRSAAPSARTILDVACGTGEHARLLTEGHGFDVDGVDLNPEFVRLAAAKNRLGSFVVADMMDFDLGRTYDAVICMFSSIGYVLTLPNLERALACFARHTAADGVIIVEPWFPPEKMTDGRHRMISADIGDMHVERVSTNRVNHEARTCSLLFEYTIEQHGRMRRMSETHELGLFTEAEMLAAFRTAGLDVVHEAASELNRGLYIARH